MTPRRRNALGILLSIACGLAVLSLRSCSGRASEVTKGDRVSEEAISMDEAIDLQRQISEYENNRPRHVVNATPADIEKAKQDWAKSLVERDMGTSIVDGGPLPLHAKIDAMFELHWRFSDLRDRVDSLEREVRELKAGRQ